MPFDDAFWHIANFFLPAVVTGCVAAGATKVFWRRDLAAVTWWRLAAWSSAAMAGVAMLGLLVFEHDGKMATYAAMVVACAAALWWAGFRRR